MIAIPTRRSAWRAAPAALLAAGIVVAGCSGSTPQTSPVASAAAGYPVNVSSCGRDFTYQKAPSRVVLGNYRTLKTLEALGVADSAYGYLLGPDDNGVTPTALPKNLIKLSSGMIPAREPLIAAGPDLFLSFNEAQLTTPGTLSYQDLAGIGANAYVLGAYCAQTPDNRSIDTVYADVTNLGRIYGVPDKAAQLNDQLRERVAQARRSLSGSTATVAFLKVLGGKVYAIGGYPASATLDALGLTNQFADLPTPFAELNTEQALSMTPDVVFVNYVGAEQPAIDALKKALPGLSAVTQGRVHGADEGLAQGGGVGIIDALEAIAADVRTANGN